MPTSHRSSSPAPVLARGDVQRHPDRTARPHAPRRARAGACPAPVLQAGETLEKLRRAKDLLGHVVAAGDDHAVLNRALTLLRDKLAREKLATTDQPRPGRPRNPRARGPSAAVR